MKKNSVAIISIFGGMMIGFAVGTVITGKLSRKSIEDKMIMSDKHLELFLMMNQWVKLKQQRRDISAYFIENGYKKIAIYGMSYVGETLLNELRNTGVEVTYGIDKNAKKIYAEGIELVTVQDSLDEVDAIVVTAVSFFDEVEDQLSAKVDCPIISLKEILHSV